MKRPFFFAESDDTRSSSSLIWRLRLSTSAESPSYLAFFSS